MGKPYDKLMKDAECNKYALAEDIYRLGRADTIDEFVKAFKDNMLKSTTPTWMCYVEEIAEQLKEDKQ